MSCWSPVSGVFSASCLSSTGILKTNGNITVYPYQSRTFTATIRVSNSESCGRTTTCKMTFTVAFTNFVSIVYSSLYPVSILYKSIAGRYRPVRVADGPITARYRFIKNAYWVQTWCVLFTIAFTKLMSTVYSSLYNVIF